MTTEDEFTKVVADLIESYAFVPTRTGANVAPIDATSVTDGLTLANLRVQMLPHCIVEIGPLRGERKINPADKWVASPERVTVAGLRLRPDMPRPTYEDDGQTYINIYHPPQHPEAGGEIATGLEFMEQLLPDPIERDWFSRHLAHKLRNPGIPGPGVILVAKEHGTGRGTLKELVGSLFGARYVKTIPFDIFAGRNYQSQYTDWAADSLVVVVNESSTADGGRVYDNKRDTYERLKDLVEPRPMTRRYIVKGLPSFDAPSFTSYIICTNHADALPLPKGDRRFAVLTNGEPRRQEFWDRINSWLENPVNIGAFARHLRQLDLGDYSPYAPPPETHAKAMMTELSDSDIDRGFELAVAALPAALFTEAQLINAMSNVRQTHGLDYHDKWTTVAKRTLSSKLERIGIPRGHSWQVTIQKRRMAVFARDRVTAKRWTNAEPEEIRDEVKKNEPPTSSTEAGGVAFLPNRFTSR
jgi:hypothetical protein